MVTSRSSLSAHDTQPRSSLWKSPGAQTSTLGKQIIEEFSGTQVPEKFLPLLQELKKEKDEAFLMEGLLSVGVRLKSERQEASAHALLARLAQADIPETIRKRAELEHGGMIGSGHFGMRAEYIVSGIAQDTASLKAIAPLVGATVLGQVAGTAVLGRLAGSMPGFWTRTLGARLTAGTAAFLTEVPALAAWNQAIAPQTSFGDNLARAALALGPLRATSFLGNQAFLKLHGFNELGVAGRLSGLQKLTQAGIPPAMLFGGLYAARHLEISQGLLPQVQDPTIATDVLGSMVSLLAGANLGNRALGSSFVAFRNEMLHRTSSFAKYGEAQPNTLPPLRQPATETGQKVSVSSLEPTGPQVQGMFMSGGRPDGLGDPKEVRGKYISPTERPKLGGGSGAPDRDVSAGDLIEAFSGDKPLEDTSPILDLVDKFNLMEPLSRGTIYATLGESGRDNIPTPLGLALLPANPMQVFAVLANVNQYGEWMPRLKFFEVMGNGAPRPEAIVKMFETQRGASVSLNAEGRFEAGSNADSPFIFRGRFTFGFQRVRSSRHRDGEGLQMFWQLKDPKAKGSQEFPEDKVAKPMGTNNSSYTMIPAPNDPSRTLLAYNILVEPDIWFTKLPFIKSFLLSYISGTYVEELDRLLPALANRALAPPWSVKNKEDPWGIQWDFHDTRKHPSKLSYRVKRLYKSSR